MSRERSSFAAVAGAWIAASLCACSSGSPSAPHSATPPVSPADAGTAPSHDAKDGAPPANESSGGAVDGSINSPVDASPGSAGDLGPAAFASGDLDPASHGGTITFEQIGAAGWYPSIRDPSQGPCDAYQSSTCCLATDTIAGDALTPWDEELVMTLRGPMTVKQIAVYQPDTEGGAWHRVAAWDDRAPSAKTGLAFSGNATPNTPFAGGVGSECQVNLATDKPFGCGPGSIPYCAANAETNTWGWAGSKLFVLLAKMEHAGDAEAPAACSTTDTGNWYDAPWVGLAVGELARAGAYASCQCFAKDPSNWSVADGCGQFNVFEVVNDNDSYKNLDIFSTDLIDYSGYVGQGPCGPACDAGGLGEAVDLVDKATDTEARTGAVAVPEGGPGAALRRPESGYRYFLILLDVPSRSVQLGLVHPQNIPAPLAPVLPNLPASFAPGAESAILGLRLP
jgi:hypothetical protein